VEKAVDAVDRIARNGRPGIFWCSCPRNRISATPARPSRAAGINTPLFPAVRPAGRRRPDAGVSSRPSRPQDHRGHQRGRNLHHGAGDPLCGGHGPGPHQPATPRARAPTALPVVPISQSSADQRQGRCGRVAHGLCIRLFSEADYLQRPATPRLKSCAPTWPRSSCA
jgi:hypothetical protein